MNYLMCDMRRILFITILQFSLSAAGYAQATRPSANTPAKSAEQTIADDYNSGKPDLYSQADRLLDDIITSAPRKIRCEMQGRWLTPMLRAKAYDQIEKASLTGILDSQQDTVAVSGLQSARVQAFMAAGKYDKALDAAKAYFNVCQTDETEAAVNFLIDALANTRARQDLDIVRRFKLQQTAWASPVARAIRAEAGAIGKANAYILALRQSP